MFQDDAKDAIEAVATAFSGSAARQRPAAAMADADGADLEVGDWRRLSHELRTPLNGILGSLELLLDGSAGPLSCQARACLGDIQVSGQQVAGHVGSLLLIVQALTAPPAAHEVPVDLLEVLQTVWRNPARTGARRSRIAITGSRFVVRGEAFWCEALMGALFDLQRGAADGAPRIEAVQVAADRLRVVWPGFDPAAVPALPLILAKVVLRRQQAVLRPVLREALDFVWPAHRVLRAA